MKTIKKIGILELCASPAANGSEQIVNLLEKKQYVAVTPQAIAVWCRQLGYEVHYAAYCGNGDPREKLPSDLDVVFISGHSVLAPLAYALSKAYRKDGTRTVCGGPHAKCFPHDALRYFDLVVLECDRDLIADILRDRFPPQSIVSSAAPYADLPTIEERLPEIRASTFWRGRSFVFNFLPMLASTGCPYACNFCVDWDRPYRVLSPERLAEDLRYASMNLPGVNLMFWDPNFGIRFDETLAVFESVPSGRRSPYFIETSLANVHLPGRLQHLHDTHCLAIAPGIESWTDYSNKAGVHSSTAWEKMDRLAEQLQALREYVPYIQTNFILGLDTDAGDEPFELTKEFLRRTPFLFPTLNVPVAFGGTPLYRNLLKEGRILKAMPFSFYWMPHLTIVLKHYDALAYYRHMVDLYATLLSGDMLRRRLTVKAPRFVKAINAFRTFAYRVILADLRQIVYRLQTDRDYRAFHAGLTQVLPPDYARAYRRQLGRYAELMPIEASQPVFEGDEGPATCLERPAPRTGELPIRLEGEAASA